MKEQLINFETAKLAKQKGFNVETNDAYNHNGRLFQGMLCTNSEFDEPFTSAPTQALVQKWLREKHKIFVEVYTNRKGDFLGKVRRFNKNGVLQSSAILGFTQYEDGLESGLVKGLKYL